MKINEIVKKLNQFHPPVENPHTSDVFKYGDPEAECTGIAVTCFASADVIQQAKALDANFIICHEPVFYEHKDDMQWLADDEVFMAKKKLLDETGIVIWRDHDSIHGGRPMKAGKPYMDGIFYGIMMELGWKDYLVKYDNMPLIYKIPKTTGRQLAEFFKKTFNLSGMRFVGDLDTEIQNVFLCEHIFGNPPRPNQNEAPDSEIIRIVREEHIDALVPLEIIDWTLSEYIRDATQLGFPKLILEMGHFNVEELGMKFMVQWLPTAIGDEVPIHYVQSGDSFGYIC
jgi:putative NIF3 family GTP cyclohydrolase 1 type 2